MAVKITKKIVGYNVLDKEKEKKEESNPAEIFQLGDPLNRPDQITGSTYKVKTPVTVSYTHLTLPTILRV